ncbi:hypothetical protein C8J57DRAFT_1459131 [Mycena rebaudengoi]|nr:hypothetical protein C8J57DRAFT_1459131 [Mycena rebaudengoi]
MMAVATAHPPYSAHSPSRSAYQPAHYSPAASPSKPRIYAAPTHSYSLSHPGAAAPPRVQGHARAGSMGGPSLGMGASTSSAIPGRIALSVRGAEGAAIGGGGRRRARLLVLPYARPWLVTSGLVGGEPSGSSSSPSVASGSGTASSSTSTAVSSPTTWTTPPSTPWTWTPATDSPPSPSVYYTAPSTPVFSPTSASGFGFGSPAALSSSRSFASPQGFTPATPARRSSSSSSPAPTAPRISGAGSAPTPAPAPPRRALHRTLSTLNLSLAAPRSSLALASPLTLSLASPSPLSSAASPFHLSSASEGSASTSGSGLRSAFWEGSASMTSPRSGLGSASTTTTPASGCDWHTSSPPPPPPPPSSTPLSASTSPSTWCALAPLHPPPPSTQCVPSPASTDSNSTCSASTHTRHNPIPLPYSYSAITPHLSISDLAFAEDPALLRAHGITHVVSVLPDVVHIPAMIPPAHRLHVPLEDAPFAELVGALAGVARWVAGVLGVVDNGDSGVGEKGVSSAGEKGVDAGSVGADQDTTTAIGVEGETPHVRILIHCAQGISRSPAVGAALLVALPLVGLGAASGCGDCKSGSAPCAACVGDAAASPLDEAAMCVDSDSKPQQETAQQDDMCVDSPASYARAPFASALASSTVSTVASSPAPPPLASTARAYSAPCSNSVATTASARARPVPPRRLSAPQALAYVSARRPAADVNWGFRVQLGEWERVCRGAGA